MTLTELIVALEAATEGSRELDGEIWKLADWKPGQVWMRGNDGVLMLQDPNDRVAYELPAPFTTSLDAALTLVPEGYAVDGWQIWPDWSRAKILGTHKERGEYLHSSGDGRWAAEGRTPALALCIASLKARQS